MSVIDSKNQHEFYCHELEDVNELVSRGETACFEQHSNRLFGRYGNRPCTAQAHIGLVHVEEDETKGFKRNIRKDRLISVLFHGVTGHGLHHE